jgi:hypothetical protein
MFNFSEANLVPGFRVRDPKEDVPGFRVAPDGLVRRSAADFLSYGSLDPDRSHWLSDYLLDANDRFAGNPYFGGSPASHAGQTGQYLSEEGSERRNYPSQVWATSDPTLLGRNVTLVVWSKLWEGDFPTLSAHIADACERA